jgi:hypothetical protein
VVAVVVASVVPFAAVVVAAGSSLLPQATKEEISIKSAHSNASVLFMIFSPFVKFDYKTYPHILLLLWGNVKSFF